MDTTMRRRREHLIRDIAIRYGVTAHVGRDDRPEILLADDDYTRLRAAVMNDDRGDALSRGYYLGLGGELDVHRVPAWALDTRRVARARRHAHFRRFMRRLTR